jgi:hypothetical protein
LAEALRAPKPRAIRLECFRCRALIVARDSKPEHSDSFRLTGYRRSHYSLQLAPKTELVLVSPFCCVLRVTRHKKKLSGFKELASAAHRLCQLCRPKTGAVSPMCRDTGGGHSVGPSSSSSRPSLRRAGRPCSAPAPRLSYLSSSGCTQDKG